CALPISKSRARWRPWRRWPRDGSRNIWAFSRAPGVPRRRRTRRPLMPEKGDKEALENARKDLAEGKAPTTAAGEFVREEIHHVREGKHGARSPKQAIAIGLSKARRAGVGPPPPAPGKASPEVERKAEQDLASARK